MPSKNNNEEKIEAGNIDGQGRAGEKKREEGQNLSICN